jgi:CRISPR-associated protein Cas2
MSLTVVITRDVEDRYRGFLASTMLEIAPGVYANPHLSTRARDTIWQVLKDWHTRLQRGSIVLLTSDRKAEGGLLVRQLGTPPVQLVRLDGVLLTRRVNPRTGVDAL